MTIELGTMVLLGVDPARIAEILALLHDRVGPAAIPLWDGHAGERAAGVLVRFLSGASSLAEALG